MSAYQAKITQCEQLLEYQFTNKMLCLEALQTSGNPLLWDKQLRVIRKNENLAVLGDVLMKAHLCKRWYSTGRAKGQWTVAEQSIINNKNLSKVGFTVGLDACVILNQGTATVTDKTMATTMEALIAATFCDGGENALEKLLETLGLDHEYLKQTMMQGPAEFVEEGPGHRCHYSRPCLVLRGSPRFIRHGRLSWQPGLAPPRRTRPALASGGPPIYSCCIKIPEPPTRLDPTPSAIQHE